MNNEKDPVHKAAGQPEADAPLSTIVTADIIKTPKGPQILSGWKKLAGTGLLVPFLMACTAPATPTPGETSQPSESPTATITFSPTPEITPSPTPEATPSIETVPVSGGALSMQPIELKPLYYLEADNMTIVAIEKDSVKNELWVALTAGGDKITKGPCVPRSINGSPKIPFCTYKGLTIWLEITEKSVYADLQSGPIGYGPEVIEPLLKVGAKIGVAQMGLSPTNLITDSQLKMNLATWKKLQSSIGDTLPRSNREFSFYCAGFANL